MKQIIATKNMSLLALIQGLYYLITGIWPILDMSSFVAVTGPKDDIWLVCTVGMLIFFVGVGLLVAGLRKEVNLSIIIIAAGAAFGFLVIDVVYVLLDVISHVYLIDAVLELILLIMWIVLTIKKET